MKKSSIQIGLYRWEFIGTVVLLVLFLLMWHGATPLITYQAQKTAAMVKRIRFFKIGDTLKEQSEKIKQKQSVIDSLITVSDLRQQFNEPSVLKHIYTFADSAQCTIAKVQIDEPIVIENGVEIPVLVNGSGSYASLGTLVNYVEQWNYAIRIRQLTLKKGRKDKGELFLDFVIMENREKAAL